MPLLSIILIIVYSVFLLFIFLYSLMQANLVYNYIKAKRNKITENNCNIELLDESELPIVTVQLPVFNEKYVVERLIEAVANFDYPKEKLEIQVLDDSTDETVEIVQNKIKELAHLGVDIQHICRKGEARKGFKAGALAEGTKIAKGDFLAIFDADFIPRKCFLKRTIPKFNRPEIGVVQTKWEHINEGYSVLTRMQAFGLDAHFSVEQSGRNSKGHFINFNGTAGIWRKTCIEDAGGWQSDTLTEDLDLSYRAQLKGWKFTYLENVGSPAELPAAMNAIKTQQFRWTKGAAECAKKNLWKVIQSDNVNLSTKIHAIFHLMNSFLFVCIIVTAVLSIPLLLIKNQIESLSIIFKFGTFFVSSLLMLSVFYWVATLNQYDSKLKATRVFISKFPMFLTVYMGLSLHNSIAVIEGYMGKKTPFVRTPKFNIQKKNDQWKGNLYLTNSINWLTIVEGLLALYFASGIILAWYFGDYGMLPFHLMLTSGFAMVFCYSINHSRNINR